MRLLLLTLQPLDSGGMSTLLSFLDNNSPVLHIRTCDLSNIDCIVAIEVLCDFFHGCVPRLDKEEVNDVDFKAKEHAVDAVILPAHGVECDSVDVLVEEQSGSDTEVEPCEALSSKTVGKNLSSVVGHKTRPLKRQFDGYAMEKRDTYLTS